VIKVDGTYVMTHQILRRKLPGLEYRAQKSFLHGHVLPGLEYNAQKSSMHMCRFHRIAWCVALISQNDVVLILQDDVVRCGNFTRSHCAYHYSVSHSNPPVSGCATLGGHNFCVN